MKNYSSAYDISSNNIFRPSFYVSQSPPITPSSSRFNFDLYEPNVYHSQCVDYPSPSSSIIVHHHPVHSPPRSDSEALSKLRQINDELVYTLAKCELTERSEPIASQSHHIHHHHHQPVYHESVRQYSLSDRDSSPSSSIELDIKPRKQRNARLTYKTHIPSRPSSMSHVDQLLISTSDAYSQQEPMTVDIYPVQDQDFVIRSIRNRPDNQKPWLPQRVPIRRNSYAEETTREKPKSDPYYDDSYLLTPKNRLSNCKERPRSSSVKSRVRPDSVPIRLRQSAMSFSSKPSAWIPSGSIKRPKYIGSNAPPSPVKEPHEPPWRPGGVTYKQKHFHAFEPTKKIPNTTHEPVWNPPSKSLSEKIPKYFEPTLKPEFATTKHLQKTTTVRKKSKVNIPHANPQLKKRISQVESKIKSAWEMTGTPAQSKPPLARPINSKTDKEILRKPKAEPKTIPKAVPKPERKPKSIEPKSILPNGKANHALPVTKTDTGRSSLNGMPDRPQFESTPRNRSLQNQDDGGMSDLFDDSSQADEMSGKSHTAPGTKQIEQTPSKPPSPYSNKVNGNIRAAPETDTSRHKSPLISDKALSDEEKHGEETQNDTSIQTTVRAQSDIEDHSPTPVNRDSAITKDEISHASDDSLHVVSDKNDSNNINDVQPPKTLEETPKKSNISTSSHPRSQASSAEIHRKSSPPPSQAPDSNQNQNLFETDDEDDDNEQRRNSTPKTDKADDDDHNEQHDDTPKAGEPDADDFFN